MRLVSATVQNFRSVEDSGKLTFKQVTCLVGKNESGKTALLKALHKLRPANLRDEKYEPSRDYPKRRWRPGIAVPAEPPVVTAEWELTPAELATLEAKFGRGSITSRTVTLRKGYDNISHFRVSYDEAATAAALLRKAGLAADDFPEGAKTSTLQDLSNTLAGITDKSPNHKLLAERLASAFPDGAAKAVLGVVDKLTPGFLYFDQYLRLPGEVSVDALLQRRKENRLTDQDQIFLALLALTGTTIEEVHQTGTFEVLNAALRAASNQISEQILQYWTQNLHLNVDVRLDQARPQDPPPFNSGSVFRTRINNARHKAETGFDDRSSGFVWFFSFLVWFNRLRETSGQNFIVLLDEPGLSLHPRAQADLLRYLNEQVAPKCQVVYTTHSPFMIDPDNISSCRTVEDVVVRGRRPGQENPLGTKVGDEVLSADPDTVAPLRRALEYDIARSLFVARHSVLVGGASDVLYLKWFSRQLEKAGKPGLDYRWDICRVGGIERIPGFVSLFKGDGLVIAALVDVREEHKQDIERARASLGPGRLLTADAFAEGQPEADVEDILGYDFYASLVNRAYNLLPYLQLPPARPKGGAARVAQCVEDHFQTLPAAIPDCDPFTPAEFLFQNDDAGRSLRGFTNALASFEKLIGELNKLLR